MTPSGNAIYTDRLALETASRSSAQMAYFGKDTAIARVLERYKIWIDTRDFQIAPHLCMDGFWESWVTLAMLRAVRPGWHCIDVGANVGYYTMIMADGAGPSGQVVAVEPNPQLQALLARSIHLNGFGGWTTVSNRALTDINGEDARLVVPTVSGLNGSLHRAPEGDDQSIAVMTATLDAVAGDMGRVDLVKIDAEGSEQLIWNGGVQTLRLNPRIIVIMELNCVRLADPAAFLRDIEAEGFPLRYIAWDGSVQPISAAKILTERSREDMMLYLQRA